MGKLIILRGNSGSGKSTTARQLQAALGQGTLLIPQDTVRRDMLRAHDGEGTPAIPLLTVLLCYGHEHCDYVILEGILKAQVYRPLFETARSLYGPEILAYYYDIPFEETLRRHVGRSQAGSFGADEMRRWWLEKDYIGCIPEKTITADKSAEETVAMILGDIRK